MRRPRALLTACAVAGVLALASPARAAGVTPAQATAVQREQAQSRFLKGKDLYTRGKYDLALGEFAASLDVVASPNTRLYVGRCLRETGRTVESYVELGRTAVEARELAREDPRYAKAAEAAEEERKQLEPRIGFVQVGVAHAAESTTLKVGGAEVRRGGWDEPVPVKPGAAKVLVETPGHAPIERELQIAAGERKALAIDAEAEAPVAVAPVTPAPAPETTPPRTNLRPWAYVAGGVGLAGFATFAFFGLKANATYDDLKTACPSGPCPPGHESDISAGKTQQTVANVGLVVGIVGAVAGVSLFVLSMPKKSAPASAATAAVKVGPSYVGLEGAF